MHKLFKSLLLSFFALFLFAGSSFATTSVRLQQPSANTNNSSLNLTFVALDTDSTQAVTVKCFKSGPSDSGAYSQFGSDIVTSAGGNTSACNANLDEGNGTYSFYVTAQGSTPATSSTVSTNFNNQAPGTPSYTGKDKITACVNRIKFKTNNDAGKTVKVEIYRADKTTFDANSGSRIGTVTIGSDTQGSYDDTLINCDTVFYYAIRAFDVYGNGSGVVGDSNVTTTTVNPTTTQVQGAIPAGGTGGGQVLGEGTKTAEKEVLGTESATKEETAEKDKSTIGQNPVASAVNWVLTHKKISLLVLLVLGAVGYYLYRKHYKKVK